MTRMRRAIGVCLGAWLIASVCFGSNAGLSFIDFFFVAFGGLGILLLWAVTLGMARWFRKRFPAPWLEPVVIAVVWAGIYWGALLDLRFLVSKPFLDRYVSRMVAGAPARKGESVGLFVARETEVLPGGVVRIITTECSLDDCGLVFSQVQPQRIGEDAYQPLWGHWWTWWRSW